MQGDVCALDWQVLSLVVLQAFVVTPFDINDVVLEAARLAFVLGDIPYVRS